MATRRFVELARGALGALALLGAFSVARAEPPAAPIADFFRKPMIGSPVLSPNGKLLAAVTTNGEGHGRLAVIDLADPAKSKILVSDADADIENIHWVNDVRLIYSIGPGLEDYYSTYGPGLWAVDVDKVGIRKLINPNWGFVRERAPATVDRALNFGWQLERTLDDGSDDIIVRHAVGGGGEFKYTEVQRLNTRTGIGRSIIDKPPADAADWWIDGTGQVLAVSSWRKDRLFVQVPDGDGWKVVNESDAFTGEGSIWPLEDDGQGRLWMAGRDPEGKTDTSVLQWLDIKHPERGTRVLLNLPGYDFRGSLILDRKARRLLGVRYETDARATYWIDPAMKALQAEIDAKLPGTVNELYCQSCLSDAQFLVIASSDRQPSAYFRYDRADKLLTLFFQTHPWIDASQQGRREFTQFKARDGMTLPVLLTYPPQGPNTHRPAVMLVHGGPWVRNAHWGWEGIAQFLASRGYVVIEPEFRGSTGYGGALFRAGFKQWGLAMQDDISDAMDWAASQRGVDAKRVCIGGASYGGYAVLMGLAKEPDRYRCGFEWVGVSDIKLMYDINWSDASNEWKAYGMPVMIGDQAKDAAQLKATSPIEQAARISRPLLMAYGGLDARVPYKHGKAMQSALEAAGNKQVEWLFYPDEGHGWFKLEDNVDFWGHVERFLAKNTAPQ